MDLNSLEDTPPWDWPVHARETIVESLQNRQCSASGRIIAAQLAGELTIMDDEMAGLLLSIARSAGETEELRAQAAISLGPALEEADTEGFDDDLGESPISKNMFHRIQEALRQIHLDEGAPKEVRRRVLEASVRAPQGWHPHAIRAAYSLEDKEWKLTAVFCMQWVAGFDGPILEMLQSRNPALRYEAVRAAGNWGLDAAWPRVAALVDSETTPKRLLLAAIAAAAEIRPGETGALFERLVDSEDEEIEEAVSEALLMAEPDFDEDEEFPD